MAGAAFRFQAPWWRLDSLPWPGSLSGVAGRGRDPPRVRPRHRRRSGACRQARASSLAAASLLCAMARRAVRHRSVQPPLPARRAGGGFCRLAGNARRAGRLPGGPTGNPTAASPAVDPWHTGAPVVSRDSLRPAPGQTAPASAGRRAARGGTTCQHGARRRTEGRVRTQLRGHRTHTHWPTGLNSRV
jgi:hypothetical protein